LLIESPLFRAATLRFLWPLRYVDLPRLSCASVILVESAFGQERTFADPSLDHLVRAYKYRLRDGDAERLGGLQVDRLRGEITDSPHLGLRRDPAGPA
jgi:hypothetical protein